MCIPGRLVPSSWKEPFMISPPGARNLWVTRLCPWTDCCTAGSREVLANSRMIWQLIGQCHNSHNSWSRRTPRKRHNIFGGLSATHIIPDVMRASLFEGCLMLAIAWVPVRHFTGSGVTFCHFAGKNSSTSTSSSSPLSLRSFAAPGVTQGNTAIAFSAL